VVWIVNTVARAQSLYLKMKELLAGKPVELQLLHARFPMSERLRREARAEAAFGPPGPNVNRPHSALLIGTQVLEQSLDFDFDLMVTDLAPVDLVLQRAGRLHRHQRDARPPGLEARHLWLEDPVEGVEGPDFGPTARVYDEAIVLASYLLLKDRSCVDIPTDIEPIVEAVYVERQDRVGDVAVPPRLAQRLNAARAARRTNAAGEAYQAELKVLPAPQDDSPFGAFSCRYDEEDPAIHEALKAVTRLGEPSVTVVPVKREGGRFVSFSDERQGFDPDDVTVSSDVARALALGALAVNRPQLVRAILGLSETQPRAFARSGLLRHHRLLVLDERGHAVFGRLHVALDPEMGLLVGDLAENLLDSAHARDEE